MQKKLILEMTAKEMIAESRKIADRIGSREAQITSQLIEAYASIVALVDKMNDPYAVCKYSKRLALSTAYVKEYAHAYRILCMHINLPLPEAFLFTELAVMSDNEKEEL